MDIIAISKDENKVLSMANKKLQEYIYQQHQDKYPTTDITSDVESP